MTKAKLNAATVGGTPDDVEAAFYDAMQKGDLAQFMACWADEDDIVCVHPSGGRALGAGEIRAAFEKLFAVGPIRVTPDRVRRVDALASAMHSVVERVEVGPADNTKQMWLMSTNVYHKTAQGWRLVAHHASPGAPMAAREAAAPDAGPMLH